VASDEERWRSLLRLCYITLGINFEKLLGTTVCQLSSLDVNDVALIDSLLSIVAAV
jgi:hypothetical protein